jgi:hypothetical protein
MPMPDMTVLAEDSLPTGERWILRAGGSGSDFYTLLQTIYPDGHRDEGGMGGPTLYAGSLMNAYTGGAAGGLRRVLVRADAQVARVRRGTSPGTRPAATASGASILRLDGGQASGSCHCRP